jgi:hypothetical protein
MQIFENEQKSLRGIFEYNQTQLEEYRGFSETHKEQMNAMLIGYKGEIDQKLFKFNNGREIHKFRNLPKLKHAL